MHFRSAVVQFVTDISVCNPVKTATLRSGFKQELARVLWVLNDGLNLMLCMAHVCIQLKKFLDCLPPETSQKLK